MERLKDKIAIVSGAANGIGRCISETLAEEGARVLVTDIDGKKAEMVALEICKKGGFAMSCRVDIGNGDEISHAVKMASEEFGHIDILCNNAAFIGEWHEALEATDEEWTGCLLTTLLGTQRFTRAVLPWMVKKQSGSIITISSIQGLVACPKSISYSTAKSGLIGFAKSIACDYGKYQIRSNVICPGPIKVSYSPLHGDAAHAYQINNTFLGRVGEPREVGYTALFLASDESSYITGAVVPVDGGWTAM